VHATPCVDDNQDENEERMMVAIIQDDYKIRMTMDANVKRMK
jgi:hypothetical protein